MPNTEEELKALNAQLEVRRNNLRRAHHYYQEIWKRRQTLLTKRTESLSSSKV